jgi:PPOX class probable F420-dependent enzyme
MSLELDDKIAAFLAEPRNIVLATISKDGTPQQSVLIYGWQDDTILLNTRANSLKVKHLRANPHVSLLLDDPTSHRYVSISGTATISEDPEHFQKLNRLVMNRYYSPDQWQALQQRLANEGVGRVIIEVKIDRLIAWGFGPERGAQHFTPQLAAALV